MPIECNRPDPIDSVLVGSRVPLTRFPTAIGQFLNNALLSSTKRSAKPLFVGSIPTRASKS